MAEIVLWANFLYLYLYLQRFVFQYIYPQSSVQYPGLTGAQVRLGIIFTFLGTGSYGNGGAMRVHPVSLFNYHQNLENLTDMARDSAKITHAHMDGYNGAVLQAYAVYLALHDVSNSDMIQVSLPNACRCNWIVQCIYSIFVILNELPDVTRFKFILIQWLINHFHSCILIRQKFWWIEVHHFIWCQ